jgi:hypothetical protein
MPTEAEQHLASLQREHPPASNWASLIEVLWDGLGERLPLYMADARRTGRIAIGATSQPHWRMYVRDMPDRSWAVIIHQDLPNLIYRILRACIASTSIGDSAAGLQFNKSIDDPRLTQVVVDIFWWLKQTRTVFGPSYPINDAQMRVAGLLAEETERFLLCHELAHVLIRPSDDPSPEDMIERLISGTFRGFLGEDTDEWDEEFLADIHGLKIVMGIATGTTSGHGGQNQLRYAGVETMLHIQHAMEILGFPVSDSHPLARQRLEVVRRYIKNTCADDEQYDMLTMFGRMVEQLLGKALDRFHDPNTDRSMYQTESDQAIAEITSALDACALASPPNYAYFYETMNIVLGRGYYHSVLPEIVRHTRNWKPEDAQQSLALELAASQGHQLSEGQQRLVSLFRRHKLIVGYFNRQENPLGNYVMRLIEQS